MKNKTLLILPAAAGAIAVIFFMGRPVAEKPAPLPEKITAITPAASEPPTTVEPLVAKAEINSVTDSPAASKPARVDKSLKPFAQKSSKAPKAPIQDPDARAALSLVGADPEAEAYWLSAISDTSLPDEERADLMEDLNEDGLSDPKNPGPQDVPLIVNRLALIENIAPGADPFMQEHLAEAYKDLNNMLAGKPVQ